MATLRLTKYMRQAFVSSVMNDVPKIDYEEQAQKLAKEAISTLMPESIKSLLKNKEAEMWINHEYIHMPRYFSNFYGYCQREENDVIKEKAKDTWDKITELHALHEKQKESRRELERKLQGCADSVTTRAGLAKLLPEFEKYMPADEPAAIKTLPAIANVVGDFVSAGWPKNQGEKA